jgi:hypothetical protein
VSDWRLTSDLRIVNIATECSFPLPSLISSDTGFSLLLFMASADPAFDAAFDAVCSLADLLSRDFSFAAELDVEWLNNLARVSFVFFFEDARNNSQSYMLQTRQSLWNHTELRDALNLLPSSSVDQGLYDALEWGHDRRVLLREWKPSRDFPDWQFPPELLAQKPNRRRAISKRLRFEVLHRADYTCQACGAKAADGAELHIDHIHPVSKGGTNDPTNLQALCRDCNLGKGARVL